MHGFTGSGEDWWACCPRLKERALAIDLPGHGVDSVPVRPFQDSIGDILDALPDSVDEIVGYSLGGRFALGLMALDPKRFRRATIISAHPGLEDGSQRADRLAGDRAWIRRLRDDGIDAFVEAWESQPLFATQAGLPTAVLERQRRRRSGQRPAGLAASLEQHGLGRMPSLWEPLTAFPGTLTWIVGASDARFLAIARDVVRRRPATRLHVLPDVGHNPLLECPEILSDLLV
ncbi:MAG: alpha/beta fold hydrolase [Thiocapsa sp.]|uniref:alpha/beta fold hydrolase n=1 Tax=Thiocapsa sp. TaxID=2024551 RepID=UPI001BCFB757|nr:alpha/beta fold hydrolase [Thiocapsa sp.]QVL51545.1 MAG: alpha/beta fold hydrolase [Thiocapsa sp.]